jgi:hypothetical protein
MTPTGWLITILLYLAIPLAVVTWRQWKLRDAFIVYSASIILLALSDSIINVILSIPLVVLSFYHIHQHFSLSQTPRASVNPTPHSNGVG